MTTQEMVNIADQNNKTYESAYGTYNKEKGFLFNTNAITMAKHNLAYDLFHDATWSIKKEPVKKMTKEQIEKALGYKVDIVLDDKEKEIVDKSKKPSPPKNKSAEKGDVITIDELMRLLFGSED
jgi:hypothetical protein